MIEKDKLKVGDTVYKIKHADVLPCDDDYYLYTIAVGIKESTVEKINNNGGVCLKEGGIYPLDNLYQTREEAQKAFINERESDRNNEDIVRAYKLLKELFE